MKEEILFDLITEVSRAVGDKVSKKLAVLEPFRTAIPYAKVAPWGIGTFKHMMSLLDKLDDAFSLLTNHSITGQSVIFAGTEFLTRLERLPGYQRLCRGTKQVVQARGFLDYGARIIVDGSEVLSPTKAYCLLVDDLVEKRTLSFETSCPLRVERTPLTFGVPPVKCLTLVGEVRVPNDFPFVVLEMI
jgi:hypothetical protein